MRRRTWLVTIVWIAALLLPGASRSGSGELIEFRIQDQFDRIHTDAELRGRIVLIFGTDKNGSRFGGAWAEALRKSLSSRVSSDAVAWVDIADLRGVPFFVKGSVKKKFPREIENWVLLDWQGTFAKAYELEQDVCNILLFDRDGRVVRRTGQTEVDPEVVSELSQTIEQLAK